MIVAALFLLAVPWEPISPQPPAFSGPAKLIIHWYQTGLTVINYPSQARCEEARASVEAVVQRRVQAGAVAHPNFIPLTGPGNGAFCIPG